MHRKRISLTKEQRDFLDRYFLYNDRPSVDEKHDISFELNMPYKAVQIWFQNTRAHIKRHQERKSLLTYSHDLCEPAKEFFVDCNALCIQPKKNLVSRYWEVCTTAKKNERDSALPRIVSTYDPASCLYILGYW